MKDGNKQPRETIMSLFETREEGTVALVATTLRGSKRTELISHMNLGR